MGQIQNPQAALAILLNAIKKQTPGVQAAYAVVAEAIDERNAAILELAEIRKGRDPVKRLARMLQLEYEPPARAVQEEV